MGKKLAQLVFSLHFFFLSLNTLAQNTTIPVNVGVVLDMDTLFGRMSLCCISMALSDFYATHSYYKTRVVLNTRDSKNDVVGAAAAALDLLKNVEVPAIIGPSTSMQANFVIDLGNKSQVPIISFAATSPSLTSIRSPYFIRATYNDSAQVKAISAIVQAFGWTEAVPIYVYNEFGEGILPFLTDALQEVDARVPYRSIIPPLATDDQITAELYKLMTLQTRVFIVHMLPSLASRLFTKAKEIGMMGKDSAWIITNGIGNSLNTMDPSTFEAMEGVLGIVPYVPRTDQHQNFTIRWKRKFQQENPGVLNVELTVFGLWAYDAATALALAVEKVGNTNFSFQKANASANLTDLESFGVSESGPQLLQALRSTNFEGLSGDFDIVDGQLKSSVYQIVNVNSNGGRGIGFWTADYGLVRELNFTNKNLGSTYSTSKENFGSIIWPGDTTLTPKGWVIPTNGKKLKIGVPVKNGFTEFVHVISDPDTKRMTVKGYCIDIFDAVMTRLPYVVPYDYIPFATPNGLSAGSYDAMVYQVYIGNYDAVVGDITIIANRSNYADFTLPYTESGVSMVVPIKVDENKNAWVFLKPLTWDLWVTSFCSFVFIGFVIWVLEHRINEEFRGPPSHQLGMIFWFSFSTMVFAHKEGVVSNLGRIVLIIWFFVVLILTQSYTASLTSMLTVQQLQPTVTGIGELLERKGNVGFQDGSFVSGLLKQKGFDDSQLKPYNSVDEWNELFQNGTIVAAFDEVPYIKLFLAKYCSKYMMVDPTYKTDGFGFVFPMGSPLVSDVSRAVLNVTEGDTMVQFEKKWFNQESNSCSDSSTSISSSSLSLESFWGLFLIAGVASLSALIIFTIVFIFRQRRTLRQADSEATTWDKFKILARQFDQKDLSFHTFRRNEVQDRGSLVGLDRIGEAQASPQVEVPQSPTYMHPSPNSCAPPSPSFSMEGNFTGDQQGMPSQEHVDPNSQSQIAQNITLVIELANQDQDRTTKTSESANMTS